MFVFLVLLAYAVSLYNIHTKTNPRDKKTKIKKILTATAIYLALYFVVTVFHNLIWLVLIGTAAYYGYQYYKKKA